MHSYKYHVFEPVVKAREAERHREDMQTTKICTKVCTPPKKIFDVHIGIYKK